LAKKKNFNFGTNALVNTCVAISLLAAQGQKSVAQEASLPAHDGLSNSSMPLQGKAAEKAQSETHLEGKAEEKVPSEAHLEGKLEQTAPLESGLSDEQLKLQAMSGQLLGHSSELAGHATQEGKSTKLQGRLEQIAQPDAKLPLELTSQINKNRPLADIQPIKQIPRFAVMPKPTVLKGNLTSLSAMTSFPDFLVGTWGGHLRVLTRDVFQPEIADARLAVDELGTVVVRFVKEEDNVNVIPPSIFFTRRLVDRKHHMMRREGNPNVKEDLRPEVYNDYPIVDMGSKHWHNAVGGQWQDDVLHHSLQRLGENGAEQDTVFEHTKDGASYGYRETVARYTWVNKTKILMQAAVVDFALDRSIKKRTTVEGYIVPEWHPFAEEISSIAALSWADIVKFYDLKIDW
jgi:hypothetical protein